MVLLDQTVLLDETVVIVVMVGDELTVMNANSFVEEFAVDLLE